MLKDATAAPGWKAQRILLTYITSIPTPTPTSTFPPRTHKSITFHSHARHMSLRKPFLCYLKDAVPPQQRFVSSFAKRVKAPNKKNKKPKMCDSLLVWRAQNSFQQLTLGYRYQRYLVFPLGEERRKGVSADGMCECFKYGLEKACFTAMIKTKVFLICNKWASPGAMCLEDGWAFTRKQRQKRATEGSTSWFLNK